MKGCHRRSQRVGNELRLKLSNFSEPDRKAARHETIKSLLVLSVLAVSGRGAFRLDSYDKKILTLEAAEKVAAAAEAEAKKETRPSSSSWWTTAVIRSSLNGSTTRRSRASMWHRQSAHRSIFRRPSKDFEDQITNGRTASLVLPGATPLQGGLPLVFDGKVIGAIGVSGNTPQEDEDIAKAGAASFEASDKAAAVSRDLTCPQSK